MATASPGRSALLLLLLSRVLCCCLTLQSSRWGSSSPSFAMVIETLYRRPPVQPSAVTVATLSWNPYSDLHTEANSVCRAPRRPTACAAASSGGRSLSLSCTAMIQWTTRPQHPAQTSSWCVTEAQDPAGSLIHRDIV